MAVHIRSIFCVFDYSNGDRRFYSLRGDLGRSYGNFSVFHGDQLDGFNYGSLATFSACMAGGEPNSDSSRQGFYLRVIKPGENESEEVNAPALCEIAKIIRFLHSKKAVYAKFGHKDFEEIIAEELKSTKRFEYCGSEYGNDVFRYGMFGENVCYYGKLPGVINIIKNEKLADKGKIGKE